MKIFGRKKLRIECEEVEQKGKRIEADLNNAMYKIGKVTIKGDINIIPMVIINSKAYRWDYMKGFIEQCKDDSERMKVFPIWDDSWSDRYFKRDKKFIYHMDSDMKTIDFKVPIGKIQEFVGAVTNLISIGDKYEKNNDLHSELMMQIHGSGYYSDPF